MWVVDQEAWDEEVGGGYYEFNDGAIFYDDDEASDYLNKKMMEATNLGLYKDPNYKLNYSVEVWHDTVHHDEVGHWEDQGSYQDQGWYDTVHHDEVGHTETVHHDEVGHWE